MSSSGCLESNKLFPDLLALGAHLVLHWDPRPGVRDRFLCFLYNICAVTDDACFHPLALLVVTGKHRPRDDPATGLAYHAEADQQSWQAMRALFAEVF